MKEHLTIEEMYGDVKKHMRSLVNKGARDERRAILEHARLMFGVHNDFCKWIEGRAKRTAKRVGGLGRK